MRCAKPETRAEAVAAIELAMAEAATKPAKYGLRGTSERSQYAAEQRRRIQIIKACGGAI
mgnify:CR=1 FL=1